ncbi:MAG: hypothetical protein R3320_11085 [Nitriliruptorales bacterium]|nr:hypothetical protein [Nitriliruptorales bacterium]
MGLSVKWARPEWGGDCDHHGLLFQWETPRVVMWWRRFNRRNPLWWRHPIRAWRWSKMRWFRHPLEPPSLWQRYSLGSYGPDRWALTPIDVPFLSMIGSVTYSHEKQEGRIVGLEDEQED